MPNFFSIALAASYQAYPSEYAYREDSVTRDESSTANCRNYPAGSVSQEQFIHCDGTPLKLTDSNFGQEQYQPADYYVWSGRSGKQLLFIFTTGISLTNITLHYYSDRIRSRPRLSFYAVPDDFDIWDVATTSDPRVDVAAVPPGGEPAGRRNVSITVNFNTKKLLMFKAYGSATILAVSEVQFFSYSCKLLILIQDSIKLLYTNVYSSSNN